MMLKIGFVVALALAAPIAVSAQTAAKPAAAAYSTSSSTIGTLLANAQTKAVLQKYIPEMISNPQISMASGMTLKAIQSYAGDALSDDVLAKIDADLAKVPAAK